MRARGRGWGLPMLAAGALALASACGNGGSGTSARDGSADGPTGTADGGGPEAGEGCGSFRSSNCPAGSWCVGETACGSAWQCQPQYPSSCTAGIVGSVCGCDGMVRASDGCPMRYAYQIGSQFGPGGYLAGSACDPARPERPPFAMSYRVRGAGLEAFAGRSVRWRFVMPEAAAAALSELTGTKQAVVQGGGFDWSIKPNGPAVDSRGAPLHQRYALDFFVDVDGDGACTTAADTGGLPGRLTVDLVKLEFEYLLGSPLPAAGQAGASLCSSFPK
jgi:hypothetical protein